MWLVFGTLGGAEAKRIAGGVAVAWGGGGESGRDGVGPEALLLRFGCEVGWMDADRRESHTVAVAFFFWIDVPSKLWPKFAVSMCQVPVSTHARGTVDLIMRILGK